MSWIVELEKDPKTGDLILPLSNEILESAGWKIGDVLEWIQDGNSWILRKKKIMKFTFIAEHESGEKITYETNKQYLPGIVEDIELFLRGCGFTIKGNLDVVEQTDHSSIDSPYQDLFKPDSDGYEHTSEYYNINRNRPLKGL